MSSALAGASPSLHVAWVLRPFDLFPAEGWGWPSGLLGLGGWFFARLWSTSARFSRREFGLPSNVPPAVTRCFLLSFSPSLFLARVPEPCSDVALPLPFSAGFFSRGG